MLNEFKVQREIKDTGLSAVCAWCERYWEAKARTEGRAFQCGVQGCCGPGKGGAFAQYKGPRPNKASYCFICSAEADMAVEIHGAAGGMIGCCKSHESALKLMLSRTGKPVVVNERLVPVMQTPNPETDA
jgi:hypothetical protein